MHAAACHAASNALFVYGGLLTHDAVTSQYAVSDEIWRLDLINSHWFLLKVDILEAVRYIIIFVA